MKVSSIIKTPVTIGTGYIHLHIEQVGESESRSITVGRVKDKTVDAIAHAINSHDPLVDMVRRLRDELVLAVSVHSDEDTAKDLLHEADERLKGEQV